MSAESKGAPDLDVAPVLGRRSAYLALAFGALVGIPLVLLLGRFEVPTTAAAVALALEALVLGALAALEGKSDPRRRVSLRGALLIAAALLTTPIGWFFGPNAGVAAAISLLVLLAGLLARSGQGKYVSWLVYASLAGGELAVLLLVLARVLPDESLATVLLPGHPDWQHAAAHSATQVVHLGGFLAGRALSRRYAEVQHTHAQSMRGVALKGALLDEARADYKRAMRALRKGALSRSGPVRVSDPPPPPSPSDSVVLAAAPWHVAAVRSVAPVTKTTQLWMDAYRTRMRGQHAAVLALCVFGSGILWMLGRNQAAALVGLASMTTIAMLAVLQRELARRRGDESSYWPWALIGALSVGPAYAFGLHSAFSCVIAALLFFGGSFRAAPGEGRVGRRLPVLIAVVVAHGVAFALIVLGVVPDEGNQPVIFERHAALEPLTLHLLLQATYVAAFAGGWAIDARLDAAFREAARAQTVLEGRAEELTRAGEGIARALEETNEGLFTGERVGRYEVGRLLASGAMGDVYEARASATEPKVAVKLVRAERATEPVALELLAAEAGALARIASPAVARVIEAGVDVEIPYVAMELIDGESLADVLRERGHLPLAEVRVLVRDLLRAVRDIHDAGVVHRDVKPHNVMRLARPSDDGVVWKVVDFGLALHGVSGRGAHGGTASYMAPEQALNGRVDPRADLYSTCLVLYRALTGQPAFVGSDPVAVAEAAARDGPPDPAQYLSIPPDVALVLRVGLAASPKDRFATARELGAALASAFDGELSASHRERARTLLLRAPWAVR